MVATAGYTNSWQTRPTPTTESGWTPPRCVFLLQMRYSHFAANAFSTLWTRLVSLFIARESSEKFISRRMSTRYNSPGPGAAGSRLSACPVRDRSLHTFTKLNYKIVAKRQRNSNWFTMETSSYTPWVELIVVISVLSKENACSFLRYNIGMSSEKNGWESTIQYGIKY